MAPCIDDARALLQQYIKTLHDDVRYTTYGRIFHLPIDTRGALLPGQTWLVLPVRFRPTHTADVRAMRGFVETVGRLSACADFNIRDFYHGFWKEELFDKVARGPAIYTEYDNLEQLLVAPQAPRFLLDLSYETVTSAHVELLRSFFSMDASEALGQENDVVLKRLTAGDATRKGRSSVAEIGLSSAKVIDSGVLQELLQLIKQVEQSQTRGHDGESVTFDISTLWMEKLMLSSSSDLSALTYVVADPNSNIRHLKLTDLLADTDKRTDDMKSAFQEFTRAILYDKGCQDPTKALSSLMMPKALISHHQLAEVCSAMRYSAQLRQLNVKEIFNLYGIPEQDCDSHCGWAWLAFAIFHPDSDIQLDRLDISRSSIEGRNMELVAEIISSVRPGRRLWELQHGPVPSGAPEFEEIDLPADQRFFVSLASEDAKILTRPKSEAPVLFVVKDATEKFEVLLMLSGWVCVIIPGYGCGWTPAAAIASQITKPTKCVAMSSAIQSPSSTPWPQSGPNVKHLERCDDSGAPRDVAPFKSLLQMIGHSLVGLDCEAFSTSDEDVGEFLDSCPNLTRLNLRGVLLTNLSALVDRYQSGQCKISSLSVASTQPDNQTISQLAQLLTEPFGKALLYVCAGGLNDQAEAYPEPFLALASALQANKTLRFLRLLTEDLNDTILKQMQDNMQTHKGIHRERRAVVAFLSVVVANPGQSSSLELLDAMMLSLVFDFAGIPVKRIFAAY